MKSAFFVFSSALISSIFFLGCGYSAPAPVSANPNATNLANRVFITNQQAGAVQIVDASTDTLSRASIIIGAQPQFMVLDSAIKTTLVYDAGGNVLEFIDNTQETVPGGVTLPSFTESIVLSSDGKTAYAALPALGQVVTIDILNKALGTAVFQIPGARRLVMSHNGNTLLVFKNGSSTLSVINTPDNTQPTVPAGFDSPFSAVFSSDDSKAYVLNCGPECGGVTAGVTVLNIGTSSAVTLGSSLPVPGGATIGVADTTNLYVAGTPLAGVVKGGRLSVINLSSLTVSNSVPISDGLHNTMALTTNNKVYIGAKTCTTLDPTTHVAISGCLSFYNIAAPGATLSAALGDVTSILSIKTRNVMYVIEGGELEIYDTTSDTLQSKQIDIVGSAVDAKGVDQ